MELPIFNSKSKMNISDDIFNVLFNEALVHQVATAYLAGGRAGTQAQKTRAEVRGGGAKPWRQKGTGRARAGTIRSPLWRKGGVIFAAKPRSYKQKVNRKMFKGAMCSILSELIRQDRLLVLDSLKIESHRTKELLKHLKEMQVEGQVLIVSNSIDENLYLAARNLNQVEVGDASVAVANPIAFIRADKVLITQEAMKELEGLLQ